MHCFYRALQVWRLDEFCIVVGPTLLLFMLCTYYPGCSPNLFCVLLLVFLSLNLISNANLMMLCLFTICRFVLFIVWTSFVMQLDRDCFCLCYVRVILGACASTSTHARIYIHTHKHKHAYTHIYIHTHKHKHACTHTHIYIYTQYV